MTIKRYSPDLHALPQMKTDPEGKWIRVEDYRRCLDALEEDYHILPPRLRWLRIEGDSEVDDLNRSQDDA